MDPNTQELVMGAAGSASPKVYVEDVFNTYLYTGNGSTQTITNGIDLSGKGGLVWRKNRNLASGVTSHYLHDTVRSPQSGMPTSHRLSTDTTNGQFSDNDYITSWNSDGFSYGTGNSSLSGSGNTVVSWTFRKAAKFFDVVTYAGDGVNGRTIAHSLGSVPGCIILKRTDAQTSGSKWWVYHRGLSSALFTLNLNVTDAQQVEPSAFNSTAPTASVFSVGSGGAFTDVNTNGATYVAYLFAHDAGGFGDSGNDNVISCGSYTGNGSTSGPTVTLGWEPQWVLVKRTDSTGNWSILDSLRGLALDSGVRLLANTSVSESAANIIRLTSTGFTLYNTSAEFNASGGTYIYIAIRRGPMKTPTDATKIFSVLTQTGTGAVTSLSTGFPVDMVLSRQRFSAGSSFCSVVDRVRGVSSAGAGTGLLTQSTQAEGTTTYPNEYVSFDVGGITVGTGQNQLGNSSNAFTMLYHFFRRAPGFFDVVAAATINSSNQRFSHNLGVTPEMIWQKSRSTSDAWVVYTAGQGINKYGQLANSSAFASATGIWGTSSPTSTDFGFGSSLLYTTVGTPVVNYLFATCPGVSKVFNYTGTGTTKQIDCGFTNGARLVLIKRTDSTGDWYIWDSARGIISGNDPYLLLNSTAAEVTNTDYIDPYSAGFEISSTAPAAINANGGSFIGLAIA